MDDNKITSGNFDYDIYSGGSSDAGDSNITSQDFDYDVYSGSSAMDYLRKENERLQEERRQASKSSAERRREEYEKRFAGMSADELFGMPEKKDPETDFSDFFDDDAAKRQADKEARKKRQPESEVRVENMMPGEDTPSSPPPEDEKYTAGIQTAAEMMARQRMRREFADEEYRSRRRRRFFGPSPELRLMTGLTTGRYHSYGEYSEVDKAVMWYLVWFAVGAGLGYAAKKYLFSFPLPFLLVCGAVGGFLGAVIKHNGLEKIPIGQTIPECKLEIAGVFIALIAAIMIKLAM